jgi:hypothetical protein
MAHHLVDVSEAVDGCSEFVSAIVQGPFPVMMFSNKDLSEYFSNLANLMLFYIPQGIPDSQLDFLYKSLKGTKAAEQCVCDSLFFAENAFKDFELTFSSICYAANKAALAFQLVSKPDFNSFLSQWFNCLLTLSKITTIPNSTFAPNSLETIMDLGRMVEVPKEIADDFMTRHLSIFTSTPLNTAQIDVPVVGLIVRRIILVEGCSINPEIMQDFVLMVLCFNLPSVISALSMIIDKLSVRLDDISPRVLDILRGINQNYTGTKEIQFNQEADSICVQHGVPPFGAYPRQHRSVLVSLCRLESSPTKQDVIIGQHAADPECNGVKCIIESPPAYHDMESGRKSTEIVLDEDASRG